MDDNTHLTANQDAAADPEPVAEDTAPQLETGQDAGDESRSDTQDRNARARWMRHPAKRVFGGVCGGLADYLSASEGLVRLLFLLLTLLSFGTALALYILFWLFLPVGTATEGKTAEPTISLEAKHGRWFAYGVIGFGAVLLAVNVGIVDLVFHVGSVILVPGLLILVGVLLLRKFHRNALRNDVREMKDQVQNLGKSTSSWSEKVKFSRSGLTRSPDDRVFAGVCGGLGRALSVEPMLIRLAFVILAFMTAFVGMAIVYVLLAIFMPLAERVEAGTIKESKATVSESVEAAP